MGRDKWSSLVWCGMGIFICVGSLRFSLGELHNPGPGFLSFYAGLILGVLALVIHFQSRKATSAHKKTEPEPIWKNRQRGWKMVMTVGALLAYAVIMNYLGFLLSTFIFLAFLLRVIEPQRWPVALLGSLAASAAFYFIFEMGLKSQLPRGLIRFF